jgi:hypothetical protein
MKTDTSGVVHTLKDVDIVKFNQQRIPARLNEIEGEIVVLNTRMASLRDEQKTLVRLLDQVRGAA